MTDRITSTELEQVLQTTFSSKLRAEVENTDLRYSVLTAQERDAAVLQIVEELLRPKSAAGEHRRTDWEHGWAENLEAFRQTGDTASLIPKYHGKHTLVRWRQNIIRPLSPTFDYHIHRILIDWAFDTFLSRMNAICEFGCGPGYHLIRARQWNPEAQLIGLDWSSSSQQILNEVSRSSGDGKLHGRRFDFFHPDDSFSFPPDTGIYTVAALEQVGEAFEPFLNFLLSKKPRICVHFEPIDELMDPTSLVDRLSVLYCRKRNYLKGFLSRLMALADQGRIEIFHQQRTYSGSLFLEGHSLVVWAPVESPGQP